MPRLAPIVAMVLLGSAPLTAQTAAAERPAAWQVAAAVLPLPDSMRPGAKVLGYRAGQLVELRAGTNGMICLADDPNGKGFQASCYHRSLEPFMARGRALRAQGITQREAIDSARLRDIQRRRYAIPSGAILASVFAEVDSFDPSAGAAPAQRGLDVIYMPYATQASTGIAEAPLQGRPWLMYAGKPWAHVMLGR